MKKTFLIALAAAALMACTKPAATPELKLSKEALATELAQAELTVNVISNVDWTVETDGQAWYSVSPLTGNGNGTLTVTVQEQTEPKARAAEILVKGGELVARLSLVQGLPEPGEVASGSFVIEEVFFAGFVPEGSTSSDAGDGDQYIKITNNTDQLLYADGLMLCISSENSQNGGDAYYEPVVPLTADIAVKDIYRIPGNGTDVPVLAGHSLVLALAAQDFEAENKAGVNLSKADFEFFDGEDVDIDNPDVPDMENWLQASASFTMLHNRGYFSLALAKLPADLTRESFMEQYPWEGDMNFVMDGEVLMTTPIDPGSYLIKNEWVVDGVNLGVNEAIGRLAFNAKVDAGYTGCGSIDRDPERYGKSALRKVLNGKLADTNNSTNDFNRDSAPSLK